MVEDQKNSDFAKRLSELMADKKVSVTELAKQTGVTYEMARRYTIGAAKPRAAILEKMATFLNTTEAYLEYGMQSIKPGLTGMTYTEPMKKGLVKVIGEAILGADGSIDMTELQDGWLKIHNDDPEAFGLKVKGDSMWPRIQSGEYVLIEPNTRVRPGDEVFVRTKEGHNMIKIFNYERDGQYQFSSINQDHRPITIASSDIDKIEYVAGILKESRHIDDAEAREWI
jgi:phage repressor protein C with HTH and peptisase S24 domain